MTHVTRVATALTVTVLASMVATTGSARAAPPLGSNSMNPTSGTATTVFTLLPPAGASCIGGASGSPSYRWQTYFVERSVDTFASAFTSGPVAIPGKFVSSLYDGGDTPIRNRNPSASPVGLISGIPDMSFNALSGTVPVGQYKIGFACTQTGAIENGKYCKESRVGERTTVDGLLWQIGQRGGVHVGGDGSDRRRERLLPGGVDV